jgi:cold shock protein
MLAVNSQAKHRKKESLSLRSPKKEGYRQPRRRGFDDDNFYGNTPPPPVFPGFAASSSTPELRATVKWYNTEKGFGFIELADGSGDVFLHANSLQAAGHQGVSPGATMMVRVGQGQKGRQVEQVISIDESTAEQPRGGGGGDRPRPPRPPRAPADLGSAVAMTGTVKWYNPTKGFGFISPQDGGKDVFIHATALEQAGLPPLQEGQVVRMNVAQGAKGPEARSISSD